MDWHQKCFIEASLVLGGSFLSLRQKLYKLQRILLLEREVYMYGKRI